MVAQESWAVASKCSTLAGGVSRSILNTDSRLKDGNQEGYQQVLDMNRTLESHGQRFCFSKTTLFEKGTWFRSPRITHPCYKRGYDVGSTEDQDKLLAPLR